MYLAKSVFRNNFRKFFSFMAAGLPSFLIAIPLNVFLVKVLSLPYIIAYCLVLLFQVTINFYMLRRYTFLETSDISIRRKFTLFMLGIVAFRAVDAMLYAFLVQKLGLYYIIAQILNVAIFAVAKYFFSKHVFEGQRK